MIYLQLSKRVRNIVNTNFDNDKMSKEGSHFISLSVVLIDSVCKMYKKCYPQVFLERFKYMFRSR